MITDGCSSLPWKRRQLAGSSTPKDGDTHPRFECVSPRVMLALNGPVLTNLAIDRPISTTLGNAAMAALASRQLDIKKIHGQLSPTRRAISAISTGCTVGGFVPAHQRGFADGCHEIISLSAGASMLLSCELDGGGGNRQAPPGGHRAARGPTNLPDARWRYAAAIRNASGRNIANRVVAGDLRRPTADEQRAHAFDLRRRRFIVDDQVFGRGGVGERDRFGLRRASR